MKYLLDMRTLVLALFLAAIGIGHSVANVVVVPLGGDLKTVQQKLSVASVAFTPRVSSHNWSKALGVGGAYLTGGSGSYPALVAPVTLPQGASVTAIKAYFLDETASANLTLSFSCESLVSLGTSAPVTQITPVVFSAGWQTENLPLPDPFHIDNTKCLFYLMAYSDDWLTETDKLKIKGFVITFETET